MGKQGGKRVKPKNASGGRNTKDRVKGKSVKANVTSKFSAKRKLSRMGKEVKRGQMGPSTEFIVRSKVLKVLQVSLKDFRRLCILKGVYPRVPTKAPKGADKVYYDIKDISYLAHEPLLERFREFKAFMKKIRRAAGRKQFDEARRKNDLKPRMILDHLVKERYPRFIDALRDLDDALCMIHLFAAMPSVGRITSERTLKCQELSRHWQYYIAKSRSLHKVFVSVKGVYFQAEVMGELITWLCPHQFTQVVPKEVDIRVMMTFLEFYEVFVKFVLFKLFHTQGLQYPLKEDELLHNSGCYLLAIKPSSIDSVNSNTVLEGDNKELINESKDSNSELIITNSVFVSRIATLDKKIVEVVDEGSDNDDDEEEEAHIVGPLVEAFSTLHGKDEELSDDDKKIFAKADIETRKALFSGLKFFLNREISLQWFQLITIAFGGQVGWEGLLSPFGVEDDRITHQVIDRPVQGILSTKREYIQPQWLLDSINAQTLLPISKYRPGMLLPPHLSPFVDDNKEGYLPKYREELKNLTDSDNGTTNNGKQRKEIIDDDDADDEAEYERHILANRSKSQRIVGDAEGSNNKPDEVKGKADKGPKALVHVPAIQKMTEVCNYFTLYLLLPTQKGIATFDFHFAAMQKIVTGCGC